MRNSSPRGAFTLVELLVVIAIMGILAAILFPALNAARAKSYDSDCQNNLRQLGAALYLYATTEGDQYFPSIYNRGPTGITNLLVAMNDYIPRDASVWVCKRYAKVNNLKPATELGAGNIGYFYWNETLNTTSTGSNGVWVAAGNSATNGPVLMSDVFYSSPLTQYHGGTATDIPLTQPATHILLVGGAVKKVAPRP